MVLDAKDKLLSAVRDAGGEEVILDAEEFVTAPAKTRFAGLTRSGAGCISKELNRHHDVLAIGKVNVEGIKAAEAVVAGMDKGVVLGGGVVEYEGVVAEVVGRS